MGYSINSSYKLNTAHLDNIINLLNHSLSTYSKITVFRVDLRYPTTYQEPLSSKHISEFWILFKKKYEYVKNYGEKAKVQYITAIEKSTEKRLHYHLAFTFPNRKHRVIGRAATQQGSGSGLMKLIQETWWEVLNINESDRLDNLGLIHQCNNHILNRKDEGDNISNTFNDTIKHLSYLAKIEQKFWSDDLNQRYFISSHFPKNEIVEKYKDSNSIEIKGKAYEFIEL